MTQTPELKVFITTGASSCSECGEDLGRKSWITLVEDKGALCLTCADLDHLVFLPAGDAALTRRSRKHSTLSEEQAVRLAVAAHVRHAETPYDSLLASGYDRWDARARVQDAVARVLDRWETPE